MPRNSSGVYALPAGNPVVTGTLIESVWANSTLSDVASSVTDSLDRTGRGAMLAALKVIDGTSLAPAFTFSSESSTGMYRPGAGALGFSILGLPRLNVAATGISVIGDADISGDTTIGGSATITGAVTFAGGATITGDMSATRALMGDGTSLLPSYSFTSDPNTGIFSGGPDALAFATAGIAQMLLDAVGNLGLGITALAGVKLMVRAAVDQNFGVITQAGTTTIGAFNDVGGGVGFRVAGQTLALTGNSTGEQMILLPSGDVGIGTTGPISRLHVAAPDDARLTLDGTSGSVGAGGAVLFYRTSVFTGRIGTSANTYGDSSNDLLLQGINTMRFNVGVGTGTEAMRVTGAGNVVVAATTPLGIGGGGDLLAVNGGIGFIRQLNGLPGVGNPIEVVNRSSGGGIDFYTAAGSLVPLRLTGTGRVGINRTPTGVSTLEVQGGIAVFDQDFISRNSTGGDLRIGYEAFSGNACFNIWTAAVTPLSFGVGTAERLRISESSVMSNVALAGGTLQLGVSNTSTAAGSAARLYIGVASGAAAADPTVYWIIPGSFDYSAGIHHGDSSWNLKIGSSVAGANGFRLGTNGALSSIQGSVGYGLACDPGTSSASVPIGSIVFAQAVGVTGAALSPGGAIGLGAGASLSWQAYTGGAGQTINLGVWRNIGAQSAGGAGMWLRVG